MNEEVMTMLGEFINEKSISCCDRDRDDKCDRFDDEFRFKFKTIREFDCELVARVDCRLVRECIEPVKCRGHKHHHHHHHNCCKD